MVLSRECRNWPACVAQPVPPSCLSIASSCSPSGRSRSASCARVTVCQCPAPQPLPPCLLTGSVLRTASSVLPLAVTRRLTCSWLQAPPVRALPPSLLLGSLPLLLGAAACLPDSTSSVSITWAAVGVRAAPGVWFTSAPRFWARSMRALPPSANAMASPCAAGVHAGVHPEVLGRGAAAAAAAVNSPPRSSRSRWAPRCT